MVLFAVYAGLYASRNIPVSSLLLILVIGPWLSDAMERLAENLSAARSCTRRSNLSSANADDRVALAGPSLADRGDRC